MYSKNELVFYLDSEGHRHRAFIVDVHHDDIPYYTIFHIGKRIEKQTTPDRLLPTPYTPRQMQQYLESFMARNSA